MDLNSAQPEGLPESSRWSESAETTGKVISHDRTPKGCQTSGQRKFTPKDLAPLRGATQLISRIPGGLRGLRPPATLFATLRVAEVSQLYSYLCEPWVIVSETS